MFVVTRYEDIKSILADTEALHERRRQRRRMTRARPSKPTDPEEAAKAEQAAQEERVLAKLYQDEGWPPVATLDALDPPVHMELRRMFDHAFRPGRVKELDPYVESLTNTLFDAFVDDGDVRVGEGGGNPAAAVRDRSPDGRARGGHAADQGVDRRVGAAARA